MFQVRPADGPGRRAVGAGGPGKKFGGMSRPAAAKTPLVSFERRRTSLFPLRAGGDTFSTSAQESAPGQADSARCAGEPTRTPRLPLSQQNNREKIGVSDAVEP